MELGTNCQLFLWLLTWVILQVSYWKRSDLLRRRWRSGRMEFSDATTSGSDIVSRNRSDSNIISNINSSSHTTEEEDTTLDRMEWNHHPRERIIDESLWRNL